MKMTVKQLKEKLSGVSDSTEVSFDADQLDTYKPNARFRGRHSCHEYMLVVRRSVSRNSVGALVDLHDGTMYSDPIPIQNPDRISSSEVDRMKNGGDIDPI